MPPMTLDPYATLGIPASASRAEAARAHRRLAKRFHPDVNPGPRAAAQMRRINEAWRILADPARRARYDAERRLAAERAQAGAHGDGGFGGRGAAWAASGWSGRARPGTSTWTTWPEDRTTAPPRRRRPPRPEPVEPSFGDHPAVFVAVWVLLVGLYLVGVWLRGMPQ